MLVPTKTIGSRTYLHADSLPAATPALQARVLEAERLAGIRCLEHYNLIRADAALPEIALLHYPDFADDPFPALLESWLVDLAHSAVSYRTYADSLNPPILHRKELLLPDDHPRRAEYAALTAAAKAIGLFDDTTRIGYRRQWLHLIQEKGYRLEGHALVPLGNDEAGAGQSDEERFPTPLGWQASRQLTALVRYGFSAPVQSLARHGFLDGRYRVFDYGCGRGDDVRGLLENGLEAAGWDPYYAPDRPIHRADIVNLGFVINVIEDFDERLDALTRAYSLAERLLVVSVMLANQNDPRGRRFRDGVLTQRGTFQKYFTQAEIKAFLEATLDEEAIPVAPGVLYVFRDKNAEQRFLLDRHRSRRNLLREPSLRKRPPAKPKAPKVKPFVLRYRSANGLTFHRFGSDPITLRYLRANGSNSNLMIVTSRRATKADLYESHREALDGLWAQWLALGRKPDKSEVADPIPLVEGFGSLAGALRFIETRHGSEPLQAARRAREADLKVYFALNRFERRKPYKHLEPGLQRDIKAFFGDYETAQAAARELLFRIADREALGQACREAAERGLGWLEPGKSLQLQAGLVEQLPPLLRIYVGCAAVLYGDYRNADLVKIHIGSGKLSLMRYDDFEGQPLPRLMERVKIKLREQDIDYFAYGGEYPPPFLYRKSRYINEEFPHYPEQAAFDEALNQLSLFDLSGYGPGPEEFNAILARHRWAVDGFELVRARDLPSLDDPCGRFLTYRQLIECGETQARTGFPNLPQIPESYTALHDLAAHVLDPIIDYFGMVRLTYGFCSPALAKEISGRIDPKRDQHAAHERSRAGRPVCQRLGAAVDFLVEDENMLEVAQWVAANTPFDRLYFYGRDRPIHVSYGPNHDRQIVRMLSAESGRLYPRITTTAEFLALT
jgi:DNA phosphorothioation-associated putative methyltransferase